MMYPHYKLKNQFSLERGNSPEQIRDELLNAPADHEGHSHCVLAMYPGQFLYCPALGWRVWTGTHYQSDKDGAIVKQAIVDVLRCRNKIAREVGRDSLVKVTKASHPNVNGTLQLLKSKVTVEANEFDNYPNLLPCANGVVDLVTGTLRPHSPELRFTYCIPIPYDPDADFTFWSGFLGSITQDPQIADYLKLAIGYSLTGHTREEVLFYIYGPTRSGKGTFTEPLLALLGAPLAVEVDYASFTARRDGDTQNFDLAPLKPTRFVAASESNKYQPLNPAKIKQITGGNFIRAAFKFKDHFTYRPQFKLWLSSNHPVDIDVDDDAAWGRVQIIEFPNSFLGVEDKGLKGRLKQPESLIGILAWAVEGAREWYATGLPDLPSIRSVTQAQREAQDYVADFIEEHCEIVDDSFVPNADLYFRYEFWCRKNGITPKHRRQFGVALSAKGFRSDKRTINQRSTRGYWGLKLRPQRTLGT